VRGGLDFRATGKWECFIRVKGTYCGEKVYNGRAKDRTRGARKGFVTRWPGNGRDLVIKKGSEGKEEAGSPTNLAGDKETAQWSFPPGERLSGPPAEEGEKGKAACPRPNYGNHQETLLQTTCKFTLQQKHGRPLKKKA